MGKAQKQLNKLKYPGKRTLVFLNTLNFNRNVHKSIIN